jgi:macrolide transport system ATP-binding/permease protein
VVLADEPTGELDTESGQQLMTMLGELRAEEGTTVVIVTHDLSLPGPGHRILSLSDGKIISDERIAETGQNQSDEIASDRTS